ncbi:hypothetical protein BDZ89DRAFT_1200086 [Hymenopellis radicata]|nr:hypothetical protein BDZ89DRAFT_1200086 [Hymenopellis radicata]
MTAVGWRRPVYMLPMPKGEADCENDQSPTVTREFWAGVFCMDRMLHARSVGRAVLPAKGGQNSRLAAAARCIVIRDEKVNLKLRDPDSEWQCQYTLLRKLEAERTIGRMPDPLTRQIRRRSTADPTVWSEGVKSQQSQANRGNSNLSTNQSKHLVKRNANDQKTTAQTRVIESGTIARAQALESRVPDVEDTVDDEARQDTSWNGFALRSELN